MNNWDIKALINNLKAEYTALKRLESIMIDDPPPPEINDYFDRMAHHSQDLASKLKKFQKGSLPLRVAVVGSFSAGKSSFINHFLQNEICPTNIGPTTSVVTRFVYGSTQKIFIQEPPEKKYRKIDHIEYKRRVQEAQASTADQIMHFTIVLPNDALTGLELMDTPGFNNRKNPNDGTVSESIIPETDVFLYLSDINNGELPESDKKTLELLKSKAPDTRILLVLNKADSKPPEKTHKIRTEFQTKYESVFNSQIFTYSAKCERSDITSRQDITNLLSDLRKDAAARNYTSLLREVQNHLDRRLKDGAGVEAYLDTRVTKIKQEVLDRDQRREKVVSNFDEFVAVVGENFKDELLAACREGLIVEEVINSSWWIFSLWNEGRVVYKSEKLLEKFASAGVFTICEEVMERFIRRLLGNDNALKPVIFDYERNACATAANQEVEILESIGRQFNSVEAAQEDLEYELKNEFESIAELTWKPLYDSITRIQKYTIAKYCDQTSAKRDCVLIHYSASQSLHRTYQQGKTLFN
ncbi:MAG: GTP-binding protein [Proteobacteria bacterium]|nr:GTP-binding protein [Pseudomonadota bacterium]